jgi:membrane protein
VKAARRPPILVRLLFAYFESSTSNYAAGLAFNAFLTMFPIVLGLFALLGAVIHDPAVFREVERAVIQAFPADTQPSLRQALQEARHNAGTIGVISIVGLLYSGTGLFASLEFALDQIYGVRGRNPIAQRIRGVGLILVFAVAIVLAAVLNAAIGFLDGQLLNSAAYLNVVAGWLVITYLMFWIYRYVPNRAMTTREVLPGAVAAGALIELLSLAFPLINSLTHQASAYTKTFTLLLALATWLYLMCQLILMGALFNRLIAEERSTPSVPGPQEVAPATAEEHAEAPGVEAREVGG